MRRILRTLFYQMVVKSLWVALRILGRIRTRGRRNVPRRGAVLMAANHISNADPPAIGATAPRVVEFMAKEELFAIPILGPLIRVLFAFPVKRGSADRAALRHAEEVLRAGGVVGIFPEGQESETGELQAFQPGAALLSLRTGAPVVPVLILGTDGVMPYGSLAVRFSRKRVEVRYGPPLDMTDLAARPDRREALEEGAERIRAAIIALGK